jgi:putative DNA primase/helicase
MNIKTLKVTKSPEATPACPVEMDTGLFPDQPVGRSDGPPCTVANVRHMLAANGVTVRYNIIRKRTEVTVPWVVGTTENSDAVSMTHILSLANLYGMPVGLVPPAVEAIADENAYNPAAEWIHSVEWDGVDRFPAFYATITTREGYPLSLRNILMRRWILSATAAAVLSTGFRCRGVLTLQGPQGIGKTSWGLRLIGDERLGTQLIKVDHHLDAGNKDSQLLAIEHWIVEVGELESSLKRDISRLKGFLTSGTDKIRRPYGRVATETQRRTVFYATVNATDFLVDSTGNARFWTIACKHIDHTHDIDMQQLFAQCAALLKEGEQWWLTGDEEQQLEWQNNQHRSFSLVRDRITEIIDPYVTDTGNCKAMTASEVLINAGISNPTNSQAKECASLLREWFGEPKRINGREKWRVPLRPGTMPDITDEAPVEKRKDKFD